ncbi:MAG: hypothetical protein ILP08_03200 [Lachnospiraceae bacterium]|nr:hypothetical protein [Lachnospiraceae bacterium]
MKGLVTESKEGYCSILREDGIFVRIKGSYEVGAEIEMSEASTGNVVPFSKRRFKTAVAAAAAALAVLVGVGGTKVYRDNTVSSYVTIDVKPSIEYSLNHNNLVLRAVALSADAAPITDELNQNNIKGKTLENAIKQTIEIMKDKGYIEDGSEEILISVTSKDEKTAASLKETAETAAKANAGEGASVIAITASEAERESASKEGKSAARVELENGTLKAEAVTITEIKPEEGATDAQKTSAVATENTSAAPSTAPATSSQQATAGVTSEKASTEPVSPGFAGGAVALTDPDSEASPSGEGQPSEPQVPSEGEVIVTVPDPDPVEYEGTTEKPSAEDPEGETGFTGNPITIH